MNDIINAIWELPWYKVLVIAAVDDVILLVKLWPLWIALVGCAIAAFVATMANEGR